MRRVIILLSGFLLSCANPNYIDELSNQTHSSGECAQNIADICTQIEWQQGPSSQGESSLVLRFAQAPPIGSNLEVILWMPSMNHGSAPVKIERVSQTEFHIARVYFIMPGDWEVRIFLKDSDQQILGSHIIGFILP